MLRCWLSLNLHWRPKQLSWLLSCELHLLLHKSPHSFITHLIIYLGLLWQALMSLGIMRSSFQHTIGCLMNRNELIEVTAYTVTGAVTRCLGRFGMKAPLIWKEKAHMCMALLYTLAKVTLTLHASLTNEVRKSLQYEISQNRPVPRSAWPSL